MRTGGLLCFLSLFLLIAGMPFGFGSHGSTDERAVRPEGLMSPKDGPKEPLNDASDPVAKQEELFKRPVKDMNTVFEISPAGGRSMVGRLGSGGRNEVGKELLFDAALGFAMK